MHHRHTMMTFCFSCTNYFIMKQQRDIVFVTFDAPRPDYPSMPYGIACLIAAIRKAGFVASHLQINTQAILAERNNISEYVGPIHSLAFQEYRKGIQNLVQAQLDANLDWLKKFRFVAFSYTRWSKQFCELAAEVLWSSGYVKDNPEEGGRIIFGGYEITAYDDDLLASLDMAHIFTKGYAERAYVDILLGKDGRSIENGKFYHRVYDGIIRDKDVVSPYLSGVLVPTSRKVYWETKRGCPYNCGFCEWGAQKRNNRNEIVEFNWTNRLKQELGLFRNSGVDEINILDGTYCFSKGMKNHLFILKNIFDSTDIKVVCQARFEGLKDEFVSLCVENRDRIHLEFGLQTIHKTEEDTIGRRNDLELISKRLGMLRDNRISYEVSLIYAIPGQTIYTFIDSIEYLLSFGCKRIRAFPLQIAANSNLAKKSNTHEYRLGRRNKDEMTPSVVKSSSFSEEESMDMDLLAQRLYDKPYEKFYLRKGTVRFCREETKISDRLYQYSLSSEDINGLSDEETRLLVYLINRYFAERLSIDGVDCDHRNPQNYPADILKQSIIDCINGGHGSVRCEVILGQSGNFYIVPKRLK